MSLLAVSCVFALCVGIVSGVTCNAGINNDYRSMDCGTSSNKCVKSRVNDLYARVCYSQMKWSNYPGFNATDGCQKFSLGSLTTEICICEGDNCNGSGSVYTATVFATLLSMAVGYLLM